MCSYCTRTRSAEGAMMMTDVVVQTSRRPGIVLVPYRTLLTVEYSRYDHMTGFRARAAPRGMCRTVLYTRIILAHHAHPTCIQLASPLLASLLLVLVLPVARNSNIHLDMWRHITVPYCSVCDIEEEGSRRHWLSRAWSRRRGRASTFLITGASLLLSLVDLNLICMLRGSDDRHVLVVALAPFGYDDDTSTL